LNPGKALAGHFVAQHRRIFARTADRDIATKQHIGFTPSYASAKGRRTNRIGLDDFS
jgi:hypothetical protein